jgi:heterodisulfide reductase subunit A
MGSLCETLGVQIEPHGFCDSDKLEMVTTNRLGIYVCGAIQGPKGIPGSVQQGSGAAGKAMSLLAPARGTRISEPKRPAEKDVTGQEPRIGVFICHCGINIAGVVDVKAVAEFAKQLPNVTYATDTMFACSTDQQDQIQQEIKKHRLNRVVVASCTPRTHESLFRDTLRQAGLNPYLFELANIREQDSWVHRRMPDVATEKAKDLVEMSISRARRLKPLYDVTFDVVQRALVIGGGLAGLTAAAEFAEKEIPVVLVERDSKLGGHAKTLYETAEKARPSEYVKDLIHQVENHPLVQIRKKVEVEAISGVSGNFNVLVSAKGKTEEMIAGAIVVATGGDAYRPSEYQYGLDSRVVTQKEFESMLVQNPEAFSKLKRIVMIQCVGSREPDHMYCSRVCCTAAVKNSLKLKTIHPKAHISVLYRDIRTFGFKEDLYLKARQQGVRFFRFERENKPQVDPEDDALTISSFDVNLQNPIQLKADLLVLSAAIRPHKGSKRIAEALRLPLDEDGFFMEAHLKLRPLDFATAGIYLCGLAQGPKFADETIVQAQGAVARAMAVLSKQHIVADAMITHVDPMICRACGECEKACLFEAIKVIRTGDGRQMAQVAEGLCTGCGACNVACPTGAASLSHFEDDQINAMIKKSTN